MKSSPSLSKSSRAFNRQSVQGAIRALQTSLKRFRTIPINGIALFAGVQPIAPGSAAEPLAATPSAATASSSGTSSERERLMVREIEPLKPLRTGMYHCDGKFHVGPLVEQLSDEISYGFVIFDGSGCHMYTVAGDSFTLVWRHGDPGLPKKHGRGGQSAPRFGRLRQIARAAWVSSVAKQLNTAFTDKTTCNVMVAGIVLCGSGELKQQLQQRTNVLDPRVSAAILPTLIDLQYGGMAGLQEAIKKAEPLINDHAFSRQRSTLVTFMEGIANDSGLVAFGARDTLHALDSGAVETLIISESMNYRRVVYRNAVTQETHVDFIEHYKRVPSLPSHVAPPAPPTSSSRRANSSAAASTSNATTSDANDASTSATDAEWRVESAEPLLDHLVSLVNTYGAAVQLISPSSTQGAQFNSAFEGIGAILRWAVALPSSEVPEELHDIEADEYDWDY